MNDPYSKGDERCGFAQPQLVLVLKNGSVWNIKLNNQMNMIKKEMLIQLPKHERYHVFQTDSNVLNFVRDDIYKNIIQHHKIQNNEYHRMIPKSSIKFKSSEWSFGFEVTKYAQLYFKHGVQVGDKLWIVESDYAVMKLNGKYFTKKS